LTPIEVQQSTVANIRNLNHLNDGQ